MFGRWLCWDTALSVDLDHFTSIEWKMRTDIKGISLHQFVILNSTIPLFTAHLEEQAL
jgi:hypothetical protein